MSPVIVTAQAVMLEISNFLFVTIYSYSCIASEYEK